MIKREDGGIDNSLKRGNPDLPSPCPRFRSLPGTAHLIPTAERRIKTSETVMEGRILFRDPVYRKPVRGTFSKRERIPEGCCARLEVTREEGTSQPGKLRRAVLK